MLLPKTRHLFSLSKSRILQTSVRNHWNKEWKPAPYPKTEAEKEQAARKYGLFPEEYAARPDDGYGIGDYPDLPLTSEESRDPHYPWDFPEYRRNFGEAIHPEANFYGEDRYDVCMKPRWSGLQMLAGFITVIGGGYMLQLLSEDLAFLPAMPPHLPANGVHYRYPGTTNEGSH